MGKVDFDNEQLHISDAEREALADVTDDELETETGDYDPEDVDSNIEDVDDTKGDAGDDDQDGADGDGAGATTDRDGDASDDDAADDKATGTEDTASAAAEDSKPADDVTGDEIIDEDATLSALPFLTPPSKEDMEKAEAAYKEAQEKFDEGEIDHAEFRQAERAYDRICDRASQVEDFNSQLVLRQWEADQKRFLKVHPSLKANEMLLELFANQVNKLLQTPEGKKAAGIKVLTQAKSLVEKGLGIEIPNVQKKAAVGDKADVKKDKGPNPRDLVKKAAEVENEKARKTVTLKDAPAADTNTDQKDRWAHIWRLSGPKFQEAVNKMSESERRAFENSH